MKKKLTKKLVFKKQTVASLNAEQLKSLCGGVATDLCTIGRICQYTSQCNYAETDQTICCGDPAPPVLYTDNCYTFKC